MSEQVNESVPLETAPPVESPTGETGEASGLGSEAIAPEEQAGGPVAAPETPEAVVDPQAEVDAQAEAEMTAQAEAEMVAMSERSLPS